MDPEEVVYWCTAGTPLGEKLSAAMMTCSGAGEGEEEPAGRKKGGGKNCKSYPEMYRIIQQFLDRFRQHDPGQKAIRIFPNGQLERNGWMSGGFEYLFCSA